MNEWWQTPKKGGDSKMIMTAMISKQFKHSNAVKRQHSRRMQRKGSHNASSSYEDISKERCKRNCLKKFGGMRLKGV